jgi:hypothetical protein
MYLGIFAIILVLFFCYACYRAICFSPIHCFKVYSKNFKKLGVFVREKEALTFQSAHP